MMAIPFAFFCVLMFIGRSEIGFKGVAFFIALWLCLLLGFMMLHLPSYWFVAAQALIDAVLTLAVLRIFASG